MTHDAQPRIRRENASKPLACVLAAVGYDDHAGMQAIADADAAAVMEAHPMRAGCGVQQAR